MELGIAVILSDNVTVVSLLQPEKALAPMLMPVEPSLKSTVWRLPQPEKALAPMPVMVAGIVRFVILLLS